MDLLAYCTAFIPAQLHAMADSRRVSYINDITGLCEDAAQAYLRSVAPSRMPALSIFTGVDDEVLVLPRVVCTCQHASRILEMEGKWDCDLRIVVRTNRDDTTRQRHRDIAGEIFSAFAVERFTLADALSTFGAFACDDILMVSQDWDQVTSDNNRSWRSWIQYTLKARGVI